MTCVHLRKLYQLCQQENLRLGSTDLIRIVCQQCGVQDECPSLLMEEYESRVPLAPDPTSEPAPDPLATHK
jgi:hypothetical protein